MAVKKGSDIDRAIEWAQDARRDALKRKRLAGDPLNPARARPGSTPDFRRAGKDAEQLKTIIGLLRMEAFRYAVRDAWSIVKVLLGALYMFAILAWAFSGVVLLVAWLIPSAKAAQIAGIAACSAAALEAIVYVIKAKRKD